MNYKQQANQFAKKHGIKLTINSQSFGLHFADDKESRYIFNCTLSMAKKQYTFKFGQSINEGAKEPEMYNILSCLQKYGIGTFENFCSESGYDEDTRKAHKIYIAVEREYNNMVRVFGSEILEEMTEIQ